MEGTPLELFSLNYFMLQRIYELSEADVSLDVANPAFSTLLLQGGYG